MVLAETQFHAVCSNRNNAPPESLGQFFIGYRAQKFFFPPRPRLLRGGAQCGDVKADALLEDFPRLAAQAPGNFEVVEPAHEADFFGGPAARTGGQSEAPALTVGNNFVYGGSDASVANRVRHPCSC